MHEPFIQEACPDVAVPATDFLLDGQSGKIVLNTDQEKLSGAPEFKSTDLDDPLFDVKVYPFFGEAPAWMQ